MVSSQPSGPTAVTRYGSPPVQKAALAVSAVFLLVGVLGFIPGITTNYDTMTFASHHSEALLLGLFNVSILHNIVHLLFGVAGLLLARTFSGARAYLIGGGAVYLVLWLYVGDRPRQRGELRAVEHRGQLAAPVPRSRHDRARGVVVAPRDRRKHAAEPLSGLRLTLRPAG